MAPMMFLLATALLVAQAGVAAGDDYGNDYLSAQPIAIGENRAGILETADDVDFFSFSAEAGTAYHIETFIANPPDTFLTLYDRDGITPLAVNDDCNPGEWYLRSCITYTFFQSGTYFLEVSSWAASSSGSYSVMVTELTYTSADDYGNVPSLARGILPGQQVPGRLEIPQDVDFFSFTAHAGQRFSAQVTLSGLVDSLMTLFDRDGVAILISNDDCSDEVSYSCLDYTFFVSGTYFLAVTSYNHSSTYTGTGGYSVLLKEICLTCVVEARGSVFIPNPVVSSRGGTFSDNSDTSSPALEAELKPVVFKIFEPAEPNAFTLDGPYVTTRKTSGRVSLPSPVFDFLRSDKGFEEVMAYYHIDIMQRYIQGTLGFTNVVNRSVPVDVHWTNNGIIVDNSNYDPSDGSITFGTGGVDDAEDAEIIAHEYGHAIQDSQVTFFGLGCEAPAMGEGFSDYWAASFYAAYSGGFEDECVGEWDASGFVSPQSCLRRVDGTKHYPEDFLRTCDQPAFHKNGEIWSATLWEIRKAAGREDMNRMVIQSHFYLDARSDFAEGAQAIIQADQVLYGGLYECVIKDAFFRRGISGAAQCTTKLHAPDKATGKVGGSQVPVEIVISTAGYAGAIEFTVTFDPAIIAPSVTTTTVCSAGSFTAGWTMDNCDTSVEGKVTVALHDRSNEGIPPLVNGTVAILFFDVLYQFPASFHPQSLLTLSNVTVKDSAGNLVASSMDDGAFTVVPPCTACDANGDGQVNIADIIMMLNMSVDTGLVPQPDSWEFLCVDKNSDTRVNLLDAVMCLRSIAGFN